MQVWPFITARIGAMAVSTIHHEQLVALVRQRACAWNHQRFTCAGSHGWLGLQHFAGGKSDANRRQP
jgi:hypothetical protein